ncbi:Vacuolar protein sorting-associated protein vta1 [Chamberlinius hualienensis]
MMEVLRSQCMTVKSGIYEFCLGLLHEIKVGLKWESTYWDGYWVSYRQGEWDKWIKNQMNVAQEEMALPAVPAALKPIQHHLKTAIEYDKRDEVVAYWCRLYAFQRGMKIDSKSKDCRTLLVAIMDDLEKTKIANKTNEAFTNDVVAQAHIENAALKLFLWADTEDRASRFNKNVVKVFYTAGILFDVLALFGELTEEVTQHRKYAKWKASYIHNCLKNGDVPIPGPQGEDENFFIDGSNTGMEGSEDTYSQWPSTSDAPGPSSKPMVQNNITPSPSSGSHAPPTTPAEQPTSSASDSNNSDNVSDGVKLKAEDLSKAQKYCKWAGSALQYEDVNTAVFNLEKALKLLKTGKDS